MKPRLFTAALLIALPLGLGACKKDAGGDAANASGEILPGSVSDAMLPEDRVTSQPPLDPRALRTSGAEQAEAEATSAPEATAAAAAEPAATKAAE